MVEIMASTATTLSGGARLGGGLHKRHFGDSAKSRLLRDQLASPGFPPQADTLGRGRQPFVNPERVAHTAHGHSPIVVAGSCTSARLC